MSTLGRDIAAAQLELARTPRTPPLLAQLGDARTPAALGQLARQAIVDHAPLLGRPTGEAPQRLRREYREALGFSELDLAYRELYPGLDTGIYGCSHSMGIPSVAGPAAVVAQLGELVRDGIGVWDDGLWGSVMDRYRAACAELVGGNLVDGDVAWFPNVSEALHATLEGIHGGTLVYTAGHFTTGHYVHHQWASNSGGKLVEVPVDADGSVPTERLVAALTPDVRVLSISHALFESGWLQDLPTLARALRERCPDALLLVDAYQTAGSVPIDAAALGDHVVVTAGGHKQLRSSAGAGFLYLPRRWCRTLTPARTGWWGHADPFAFEKGPVRRAEDATRFRSGTPTLAGMAMLLGELAALGSSADGSISGGVRRARRVTTGLVAQLCDRARGAGLRVRGDWPADRRAAFVCLELEQARGINDALGHAGIRTDFRPRRPGGDAGWIRASGNSAAFPYEMDAIIDAIAAHPGSLPTGGR